MSDTMTDRDWWNDTEVSDRPLRIMTRDDWQAVPGEFRIHHNGRTYIARTVLDAVMIVPSANGGTP